MSQKSVVRRKPKYRVNGYLDQHEEIVIQARLDAQIHGWMMQDKNFNQSFTEQKEHEVCVMQVDTYEFLDMDAHRIHRSKTQLLNTYLIDEIAFFMLLTDTIFLFVLQIYMNWSFHASFNRGYCIALMTLLSIHVLYCISIYMLEKYKDYQNDVKMQNRV